MKRSLRDTSQTSMTGLMHLLLPLLIHASTAATGGCAVDEDTTPLERTPGGASMEAVLQGQLETANTLLHSPGMVIGVQIGDDPPWIGATGILNQETREPMNTKQRFRLGSITKSFLGTCVLQLVGEGKIGLDDTLETWLPGVFQHIDGKAIKIRNLLSHTSGIESFTEDINRWFLNVYQVPVEYMFKVPDELLAMADGLREQNIASGSVVPVGEFRYSNTNFILLAMIATKADGIPNYDWATMVKKRVFDRVGMKDTSIPEPSDAGLAGSQNHGYINWMNNLLSPCDKAADLCLLVTPNCENEDVDFTQQNMTNAWAAGAIISTAEDLLKYLKAQMRGDLLTDDLRAEQQSFGPTYPNQPTLEVGLAIFRQGWYGLVGHRGEIYGFNATIQYQPDTETSIVVLSNRTALDGNHVGSVPESLFGAIFPGRSKQNPLPPSVTAPVSCAAPPSSMAVVGAPVGAPLLDFKAGALNEY